MATLTRRLTIHGRVQGVGFRWQLTREAEKSGLAGWVRNRSDGSVEAQVSGPPEAVEALTAWAHRGPPQALVERVLWQDEPDGAAAEADTTGRFIQFPTL